jgi:hypothetical protein
MPEHSMLDPQLLYRRQYIAGPSLPPQFATWRQIKFSEAFIIGCHPEIEVAEASNQQGRIVCLGHILDPVHCEQTNSQVLSSLLESCKAFSLLEKRIGDFGGRWVMFVELHQKLRVYLDAGGLKSTFWYTDPQSQEIWIGSQPSLFEDSLGIAVDKDMVRQFWTTKYQNSWVCEVTPYPHVRQLLPNHYLDVNARSAHRFWPTEAVEPRLLDEAAVEMSEIIHGLIASVVKRGPVALPLTGGYESRVTFSCAKELREKLPLYLIDAPNTVFHDRLLSRQVAAEFGLKVSYLQPVPFDERYWKTFLRNTAEMYWDQGSNHIYTYGQHFPNYYLLIGQSNNVTRAWYYKDGKQPIRIDPETLAKVTQYSGNPIALRAFDEWLSKAPATTNISLLDLIFWEYRTGNWGSLGATAFDTVGCDTSSPYNCRRLMEIALGVDVKYRKPPHILLRRIAEIAAGAKALSVPINYHWVEGALTSVLRHVPWRVKHWVYTARMKRSGVPDCVLSDFRFH